MDQPRPKLVDPLQESPPTTGFKLRMWSYDIAREQCPTLDHLRRFATLTEESGYNALGLYLEHRFAFECTPWSRGVGCETPEMVRTLQEEFPKLQILPLLNLLGHCEGLLYTEELKRYREELFKGMQACPSNPAFVDLCELMVDEAIEVFQSEIIHIGGDETKQLGHCPQCSARVEEDNRVGRDGKAWLYGGHFRPLCERVLKAGRRPAIWGDMLLAHPEAAECIPKETLIFDWHYRTGLRESTPNLLEMGYEVVGCPTLHTYNAVWFHIPESEKNVAEVVRDATEMDLFGVCLTTWECGLFGAYDTLIPAIRAIGKLLEAPLLLREAEEEGFGGGGHQGFEKRFDFEPDNTRPEAEWIAGQEEVARSLEQSEDLLELVRGQDYATQSHPPSIVRLVDAILQQALDDSASEIRIARIGSGLSVHFVVGSAEHEAMRCALPLSDAVLFQLASRSGSPNPHPGAWTPFRFVARDGEVFGEIMMSAESVRIRFDRTGAAEFGHRLVNAYESNSPQHGEWARLMGVELRKVPGVFALSPIRNSLKCRFMLYGNPFLLWMHHADELCGKDGDRALAIIDEALSIAPAEAEKGVCIFARSAIEFVRLAEAARLHYSDGDFSAAIAKLAPTRLIFEALEKVARRTHERIGGSLADIERCRVAREHVERVIVRIRKYGDGSLGYLPAFEILTHPKFMPHDQGSWWLVNEWANE